jgi:nicotinamide N-methyltransferase
MEPEEILSSSLATLYDYAPISHSSPGGLFTYNHPSHDPDTPLLMVTVSVPDTQAKNWSLQASTIWASALYVADHISELNLPEEKATTNSPDAPPPPPLRLIELGAGAGLPSIVIAKRYPHIDVIATDYPDADLIRTLRSNVARNRATRNCTVVPHAWGTDPSALLPAADVVLAADALWDPALHGALLRTMCAALGRTAQARAHVVAGLHTGRYALQAFWRAAEAAGLVLVGGASAVTEREVRVVRGEGEGEGEGEGRREWDVGRVAGCEDEDERERRRWVVWSVLKWADL